MGGAVSSVVKPITSAFGSYSSPTQTAPSTAVVSQSSATSATETETAKKRRRGKSPTILTTASGAEGTPTLGTTSLLGQ
jgi:hypothetical protein